MYIVRCTSYLVLSDTYIGLFAATEDAYKKVHTELQIKKIQR